MKGVLFKDFRREIRKSLGRFISIFTIVLIGVSFFSGVKASAPDMRHSADKYYDDYNMMDIRIMSTLGLSKEDIEEISKVENVDKVQPGYFVDAVSMIETTEFVFRLHSVPSQVIKNADYEYINAVNIVEGRLPRASGECVIEEFKNINLGLKIGDTLKLSSGKDIPLTEEALNKDTYTIVGKAVSPYYLSYEKGPSEVGGGKVNLFLMIPEEDFKYPVYTEALVTVKEAKALNSYSKAYEKLIEKALSNLENLGVDRSSIRLEDIKAQAMKKLQEAKDEYNKAKASYDEEISNAEKELNDAHAELVEGETTLKVEKENYYANRKAAVKAIVDAEKELAEGEASYAQALKDYNQAMELYGKDLENLDNIIKGINSRMNDAKSQIAKLESELQNPNLTPEERAAKEELLAGYKALVGLLDNELKSANNLNDYVQGQPKKAKEQLDKARKSLDQGRAELSKAKRDLASGDKKANAEFAAAEKKLKEGWEKYNASKEEFEKKKLEGATKLEEAREKIIRGEDEIERLSKPKWHILDRTSNYGFMDYKLTAERINAIANVFPVFFFLVAALVCLTTMTRMVDEQRGIIGTYKALGYSSSSIASKYVLYAAIASFFGGISGIFIGMNTFPKVIFNSYSMMYTIPGLIHVKQPMLTFISIIMGIIVTTSASLGACYNELKEMPSMLLRPKAPKAGKAIFLEKITSIWKKLSFSQKVTARNLFRYKKRFFMTVIGISGCAALLLAGFGLNNSISQVVNKQYREIFNYDLSLRYKAEASKDDRARVMNQLKKDSRFQDLIECTEFNASVNSGAKDIPVTLIVPKDGNEFNEYITLRNRKDGKNFSLPSKGIVITEKLAKELGVGIGSSIELDNSNGSRKKIEVADITENYVFHYAYMSQEYYNEVFRLSKDTNSLLIKLKETSADIERDISRTLIKDGSIASITFYSAVASEFQEKISSLNNIVYVIIICAGLLAFVVLYNLTNINIGERIREIATIKVLGFYNPEVTSYVYRENIILSLIGALAGLILGIFLHRYIMVSIEQDGIMFGNLIKPVSFLYSFIITMVFSILVNLAMYKKLVNIPMVESLKSIE
ncbi:ABC transporter permease [Clostridium polynesiense]|uniref:ABC transporter permease n=1 Tax=Clostridium polynesiense TaxID=1325933 RepID=UPI00058F4D4B|nr:ABC transporter permease [Clostridium polynesiense]